MNFFRLHTWVFSYLPKMISLTTAGRSNFKTKYCKRWRSLERIDSDSNEKVTVTWGGWLESEDHLEDWSLGLSIRIFLKGKQRSQKLLKSIANLNCQERPTQVRSNSNSSNKHEWSIWAERYLFYRHEDRLMTRLPVPWLTSTIDMEEYQEKE